MCKQKKVTGRNSHLVMSGLTVTPKVIDALCCGVPIVTVEWFEEIVGRGKVTDPIPEPSARSLPPIKEKLYEKEPGHFLVNAQRGALFQGDDFLFIDEERYNKFKDVAEAAGATTRLYTHRAVSGRGSTFG